MRLGTEWVVECSGCTPTALADLQAMRSLMDTLIAELDLHVVGEPQWHKFSGPGGVTGLYLLTESHIGCHTYPEHGAATFNLYCCRERPHWPWRERLQAALGATEVNVRVLQR